VALVKYVSRFLLIIVIIISASCESNNAVHDNSIDNADSSFVEKSEIASYRKSGKGLYIENCGACHLLNASVNGAPFIDIVNRRTVDWAFTLVTDSTFLLQNSGIKSSDNENEFHIQFSKLTRADLDSIWKFTLKSASPVGY
jgi:cytochrome c5